uniref:Lipocalin n=1 Tax=Ixodes ricinus TaxID=34613 RepID=A0A147BV98_IXORI
MRLVNFIYLCIALLISPYYTNSFPDVPSTYVTQECRKEAEKFVVQSVPLEFDSALFCMFQNLQVLEQMRSLQLALTTPHTGRSICRIEVYWFNKTAREVNMTIYDTDLQGNCTPRNGTVIVKAHEDWKTKQLSELRIPRTIGREKPWTLWTDTRLLFTDYDTCLIFITSFNGEKYCELFVASKTPVNMYVTACHSIYRIYCGYGRPKRDAWPNPVNSSSDDEFLMEAHKLRMLLVHIDPLQEDTIFMNEFQMITEVLYNIPEANLLASTSEGAKRKRICGIQIYKIMPDFASLEVRAMISGAKYIFSLYSYYSMDANAISPTRISLLDQQAGADLNRRRERRVLVSNFKNCFVLKTINNGNQASFCELFVNNNTDIRTGLDECSFVFLAYCGYPTAVYDESSCYTP